MKSLIVLYDDWCPYCSRTIKIVKKLDWFNLINEQKLREIQSDGIFETLDLNKSKQQMPSYNGRWNYGFNSMYLIHLRLPLLWLLFPIVFLFKISGIGQFLYLQLAINRKIIPLHCAEETCVSKI